MQQIGTQKDSNAWIFQTWVSFVLSVGMTTTGVIYLPVDLWVKGFVGMGLGFSIA
uniref:YiaA/YiaB family inner membrane protein n=1 Tax=Chamaesiphon sp. OTE_75_metabat_556 TaxID=2964692 RepID=UPI00286D525B